MTALSRRGFLSGLMAATALAAVPAAYITTRPTKLLWVNVKDFGARGCGFLHNDGAAFKAAMDAVSEGGTIYFPPGEYYLGNWPKETKPRVIIAGAGSRKTKLIA